MICGLDPETSVGTTYFIAFGLLLSQERTANELKE